MLDKFGEIMRSHFRDRSCELPGLDACGSLDVQITRFVTYFHPFASLLDCYFIYMYFYCFVGSVI